MKNLCNSVACYDYVYVNYIYVLLILLYTYLRFLQTDKVQKGQDVQSRWCKATHVHTRAASFRYMKEIHFETLRFEVLGKFKLFPSHTRRRTFQIPLWSYHSFMLLAWMNIVWYPVRKLTIYGRNCPHVEYNIVTALLGPSCGYRLIAGSHTLSIQMETM